MFINNSSLISNNKYKNNYITFKGNATQYFSKNFVKTEKEIIDIFLKDPESKGIAGTLPPYWLARLEGKSMEEKTEIIDKVFLLFRAAVKYLHPYNANKGQFKIRGLQLENKRVKEASKYLTKGLRHFGILSESNMVILKKLKVGGSFTDRAYALHEYGDTPSLEPLFIKKFKKRTLSPDYSNIHGKYSELAHGLYINGQSKESFLQRVYWGDTKVGYIATEYVVPPKHVSPIVHFKAVYNSKMEFAKDFFAKTGIKLHDLEKYKTSAGKENADGTFVPFSKDDIIIPFLRKVLNSLNLVHTDLHNKNAIIGSTRSNQPIIKIIDFGGIVSQK